eukprot:196420_1
MSVNVSFPLILISVFPAQNTITILATLRLFLITKPTPPFAKHRSQERMELISFVILYGLFTITNAHILECKNLRERDFSVDGEERIPCWFCVPVAAVPGDSWLIKDNDAKPTALFAPSTPEGYLCPPIESLNAGKALKRNGDLAKYKWVQSNGYGRGEQPNPLLFQLYGRPRSMTSVWHVVKEGTELYQLEKARDPKAVVDNPCAPPPTVMVPTKTFGMCFYQFDRKKTKANGVANARGAYLNRLYEDAAYRYNEEWEENNLLNEIDSVKQNAYSQGYKNGFTAGVSQAQKRLVRSKRYHTPKSKYH